MCLFFRLLKHKILDDEENSEWIYDTSFLGGAPHAFNYDEWFLMNDLF